MSTKKTTLSVDLSSTDVLSAVVAAVLGSITFDITMSLTMDEVLFTAIPGMYGFEGVSRTIAIFVGWVIHRSHGTVLGLIFGVAVTIVPEFGARPKYGFIAGVAYWVVPLVQTARSAHWDTHCQVPCLRYRIRRSVSLDTRMMRDH